MRPSSMVDSIALRSLSMSDSLGESIARRYDNRRLRRLVTTLFQYWREDCYQLNSARRRLLRCFAQKVVRRHVRHAQRERGSRRWLLG